MNERLELRLRMKDSQRARVSEIRIFHAQYRDLSIGLSLFTQIDRGRARGVNPRRITRIREKRDMPLAGLIKPRRPDNLNIIRCPSTRAPVNFASSESFIALYSCAFCGFT